MIRREDAIRGAKGLQSANRKMKPKRLRPGIVKEKVWVVWRVSPGGPNKRDREAKRAEPHLLVFATRRAAKRALSSMTCSPPNTVTIVMPAAVVVDERKLPKRALRLLAGKKGKP